MKRLDLVQLTIIIVGIVSAFFLVGLLPRFFLYLISWFTSGLNGGYYLDAFIENILLISLHLVFSIYAIKNSKQVAEWICNKANLNADVNFALNTRELLFVLFVGLGTYGLIKGLSNFLVTTYRYIKGKNSFASIDGNLGFDVATQFITVGLFFILLYYAKLFADLLAAKINNVEPVDAINETPA